MRASLIGSIALVFLGACRPAVSPEPAPAADPLATQRQAFVSAFNRGDKDALRALYASDALFLAFTGQAVTNPDFVIAGLSRAASLFDLELEPLRGGTSGDLRYEAGTWRHREKGSSTGSATETGNYVWLWRRDAQGAWVIHLHSVSRKPPSPPSR
jgi:ketosteroid isomerase-like protein